MILSLVLLLSFITVHNSAQDADGTEVLIKPRDPFEIDQKPVPFGHIFKDGIDDPSSDFKVPYDLLELDMRFPRTREEEKKLLKDLPRHRIVKLVDPEKEKYQINPRDPYLDELLLLQNRGVTQKALDDDKPRWFNFEKIQERNIARPPPKVATTTLKSVSNKRIFDLPMVAKADNRYLNYFSRTSFNLLPDVGGDRLNWTTCDDFGKGLGPKHMFHPKDIVDLDWEPFYVWSYRKNIAFKYHRFSYATKKVVREYQDLYGRYLNKSLDWEQPKLLMKEDVEMLLIAADRKGLFRAIPRQTLSLSIRNKNISLPIISLRLKIEDPYLAMMYCDDFYATIMASPGNSPENNQEKEEEASILKFKGEGYPISNTFNLENIKIKRLLLKEKEKTEGIF